MLIIGYPGVGKSTYCKSDISAIDLESSNFNRMSFNSDRDWAYTYLTVARDLIEQGYIVCISSHDLMVRLAPCYARDILVITPDPSLKEEWLDRLQKRCDDDPSHKNERAYFRALEHFDTDVRALIEKIKVYSGMKLYTITKEDLEKSPVDIFKKAIKEATNDKLENVR